MVFVSPWPIIGNVIGWAVLVILALVALIILWGVSVAVYRRSNRHARNITRVKKRSRRQKNRPRPDFEDGEYGYGR